MHNSLPLFEKYEKIRPFFEVLKASNAMSYDKMSVFWLRYLQTRHNFPSFNEILLFRRGMASGIGYKKQIDQKNEYDAFLLELGRAQAAAPMDFLIQNQESNIGLPYQYFKNGIISSSAGLHNCVNVYYIIQAMKKYLPSAAKYILEIGAGYGGSADLLIRILNPDVYVICDLPQNLFLSAYYLSVNHPEYELFFVNENIPSISSPKAFVFLHTRRAGTNQNEFRFCS